MPLEQEVETYQRELPKLLDQAGQFVLIHGKDVAGFFETYSDALQAGYDKFYPQAFMVKKIEAVEPVLFFSRNI